MPHYVFENALYGSGLTLDFVLFDPAGDFIASPSNYEKYSNPLISQDQGGATGATNAPVPVGNGFWRHVLTGSEMSAAQILWSWQDDFTGTKQIQDISYEIRTFGHTSAFNPALPADLKYVNSVTLPSHQAGYVPTDSRYLKGTAIGTNVAGYFPSDLQYLVGDATAAANQKEWMKATEEFIVQASPTPTVRTCKTDLASSIDDFCKDRAIYWSDGVMSVCTAFDGTTKEIYYQDRATAPGIGTTARIA